MSNSVAGDGRSTASGVELGCIDVRPQKFEHVRLELSFLRVEGHRDDEAGRTLKDHLLEVAGMLLLPMGA